MNKARRWQRLGRYAIYSLAGPDPETARDDGDELVLRMALVRLEQFEEAADWGVKAAARPNAHAHIMAIAAYCLALAGRPEKVRTHMTAIRKELPDYCVDDFLAAMQFAPEGAALFREGAKRIE